MSTPSYPFLQQLTGWKRASLAVGCGGIASLGHAPLSQPIISLLGFAVFCGLFVASQFWNRAFYVGWFFGVGYFGLSLSWIVEPFFVHAARDGWLAPFAISGMAGGLAMIWGVGAALAFASSKSAARRILALSVAFALAGLFRENAFTGFPWALPAYVWSETPVAQSLAWFGPHSLSFLTVLVAGSWLVFARPWIGTAVSIAGIVGLWVAGELRLAQPELSRETAPVIRIVQPNVPQLEKWDPAFTQQHFERLLTLTATESETLPNAVVWPETAATFLLQEGDVRLRFISTVARGAPVAIGIRRRDGRLQYNSIAVVNNGGSIGSVYDKNKLVPFGEYVPLQSTIADLGLVGLASHLQGNFTRGQSQELIEFGVLGAMQALICYESIFPRFVRQADRGNGIIQVTNDGWFGLVSGPQQHLAQARMRAIELGLPLFRAANSGISAAVDSKGRVLHSLPLRTTGIIDVVVPPTLPPTMYSRFGDLPLMVVMFCLIVGLVVWPRRRI